MTDPLLCLVPPRAAPRPYQAVSHACASALSSQLADDRWWFGTYAGLFEAFVDEYLTNEFLPKANQKGTHRATPHIALHCRAATVTGS